MPIYLVHGRLSSAQSQKMALNHCCVASPPPSFPSLLLFHTDSSHHSPKLQLLRHKRPKSSSTQFSLFAIPRPPPSPCTSPSHSSTTPIDKNSQPKQDPEQYPVHNVFNSVQETEFDFQNGFKDEEDQLEPNIPSWNPKAEGVLGEILEIVRNLKENSALGQLLGPFEGRLGEKECLDLLGLMAQEGLVMGCLYFFEWMGLQEPSMITPQACLLLFPVLGRGGMGEALVVLAQNLPNTKEFKDVHVYNAAISGLSCSGRYDDAWEIYGAMETYNVQPDDVTCSTMITMLRKSGRSSKEAWEFFQRMSRKGVGWSLESVSALIKSFCAEGLKKEALIIQIEMEKKGISSNAIVYHTLMDAYVESNQVEEAEGLFAEMKRKGIKPTSATYNILMEAYSRRMQPEIIEKLLLEMENNGLVPSAPSYTSLISAYGRQRKMGDMAVNAFSRMKTLGIKPTSHSYTALIQAFSVCRWHEQAFIAFENMQVEEIKPSVETYNALLDAFRRAGDPEMLMNIWKLMISENIQGTRVTFNILLDGFAKQGCYAEARDVISEFGKIGLKPTVMTYNMLMNAYARGGQPSKLPQLLKEMSALSLRPDSITYSTMIYAYARVRDFNRAFFYHKEMVKSGNVPDPRSYEKLRAILDVKAALKNKKDKKAVLGILNSKMGMLKSKEKGKKDEFWKNKKKQPKFHLSTREGRR